MSNQYFTNDEVLKYTVNVIPDLHPSIRVNTAHDSLEHSLFYYRGIINDDYGFKNLYFCYNTGSTDKSVEKLPLQVSYNLTSQEFYHVFDFTSIAGSNGEKVEYWFEVWDNDAVNGSKSARTNIYEYNIPSDEELQHFAEEAKCQCSVEN